MRSLLAGEEVEDAPLVYYLYRAGQFEHWSPLETPHCWLTLVGIIREEEREYERLKQINTALAEQWNDAKRRGVI